jgi:photosystem II stability/assembly factor-like uncharacterized protein
MVALDDLSSDCSQVYLTNDFVHWRNVTPPAPLAPDGSCLYEWQSASFVSSSDGWVLGRDGGDVTTVLDHTVDGGLSWVPQPGGTAGSNGGAEVIGFANEDDGWRQQFAVGSNAPYTLEVTRDAGSSWQQIAAPQSRGGCQLALDVFSTAEDGFAGDVLPPNGASAPTPWLWQTTDGGSSWHEMTVTLPSSLAGPSVIYGLPSFFGGPDGVLPVVFGNCGSGSIGFYATSDFGLTWSLEALEPTTAALNPAETCSPNAGVVQTFPAVGIAGPDTWWVVTGGKTPGVAITTDGGRTWAHIEPTGMPSFADFMAGLILQPPVLEVESATVAWIFVDTSNGSQALWGTIDGGYSWKPVFPRT